MYAQGHFVENNRFNSNHLFFSRILDMNRGFRSFIFAKSSFRGNTRNSYWYIGTPCTSDQKYCYFSAQVLALMLSKILSIEHVQNLI